MGENVRMKPANMVLLSWTNNKPWWLSLTSRYVNTAVYLEVYIGASMAREKKKAYGLLLFTNTLSYMTAPS